MADVLGTLNTICSVVMTIKDRFDTLGEAKDEMEQLAFDLGFLQALVVKADVRHIPDEYVAQLGTILTKISKTCEKCAKYLEVKEKKAIFRAAKFGWSLYQSPALLHEINRRAAHVERLMTALTLATTTGIKEDLSDMNAHNVNTNSQTQLIPSSDSQRIIPTDLKVLIDELVGKLKNDCQKLQEKLDRCILVLDSSVIEELHGDNPEGISFWRDRFRTGELSLSSIAPYESLYVSWARFIREIETSFGEIKGVPVAKWADYKSIDEVRKYGSRYRIDVNGALPLKAIRPLWLPALQEALDPFRRGYIKPDDYLEFLQGGSLKTRLKQIVLDTSGYGTLIDCQRASQDISLPPQIESSADHVGWMSSCEVVAVSSPNDLGIIFPNEDGNIDANFLLKQFAFSKQDVTIYVRYLQTGQIEPKLLSKEVRPLGGLRIGSPLAIRYDLEDGSHTWSNNFNIVELTAHSGGQYLVTAGSREDAITFFTKQPTDFKASGPLKNRDTSADIVPELEYCLLGPSNAFTREPKIGEKIQVTKSTPGYWYDVRVTSVDGNWVYYEDWDKSPNIEVAELEISGDKSNDGSDEEDGFFFGLEEAEKNSEGGPKVWQPWVLDIVRQDVRPYRCLDIGDYVEAPVIYPDYRFHYYDIEESQLFLPARIVDIEGDEYIVEFSSMAMAYKWWPGRIPKSQEVPLQPASKKSLKNPFDKRRVQVSMDHVRPTVSAPHPVLGTISIKPQNWTPFQGVHMAKLEDIVENGAWNDKRM